MSSSKKNSPARSSPDLLRRSTPQQQLIERRQEYQGLIPPPVILQQFDELIPGTAGRIIQWAEDEQNHRQQLERQAQEANIFAQQKQLEMADRRATAIFRSDLVGQILGFAVCMACVVGAVYLAIQGHEGTAAALAIIPTAAIIQAFRSGVFSRRNTEPAAPKK